MEPLPRIATAALVAACVVTVSGACTGRADSLGSAASGRIPSRSHGATAPSASVRTTASRTTASRTTHRPRPSSSPARTTSRTTSRTPAERALARMDLPHRVGQLLMVDCPSTGIGSATATAVRAHHVGAVILDGTTTEGVAGVQRVTAQLRRLAPRRVGLFIATDQEGGVVQRLQGAGFSSIPSALQQGRMSPSRLRSAATTWGRQLHRAGVDVDLAPVLDTVPPGDTDNPPIGNLDREYGHRPRVVTRHALAYLDGMRSAGIVTTGKHFPGLGRVHGNTDTTSGVTDGVTTRHDAYLRPFRAAVRDHVPFVMVSTAIYSRIDPHTPAAFSPTIVRGLLRQDLGFHGVVITDDVGAAAQVANVPVGQRAVRFVAAGGDMVLTVNASQAAAMTHALIGRARASRAFRRKVDAAALRVLQAKQRAGLLRD